jgi:hypothetical protein
MGEFYDRLDNDFCLLLCPIEKLKCESSYRDRDEWENGEKTRRYSLFHSLQGL